MKKLWISILILAGFVIAVLLIRQYIVTQSTGVTPITVTNFEECVRAGYPVGESYPRQCWTSDKHFTETIPDGRINYKK